MFTLSGQVRSVAVLARFRSVPETRNPLLTNKAEEAALILRNSSQVVRKHYIPPQREGARQDAMNRFEHAYMEQSKEPVAQSIGF